MVTAVLALAAPAAAAKGDRVVVPKRLAFNECLKLAPGQRFKLTLPPDADLQTLCRWLSGVTCKRVLVNEDQPAPKLTIRSPEPITRQEAYRAFLSALNLVGMTVVDMGGYLNVITIDTAIRRGSPVYVGDDGRLRRKTGEAITQVVRVRSVPAQSLVPILERMGTRRGRGSYDAFKPTNTLIISDAAALVKRMLRVIRELDQAAPGQRLLPYRLRHARADEVKRILDALFLKQGQFVPRLDAVPRPGEAIDLTVLSASKVVAEPSSNTLYVVATEPAHRAIRALLAEIDRQGSGPRRRPHVHPLKNRTAEEVARVLAAAVAGSPRGARPKQGAPERRPVFEDEVKVTADKSSNSLVIVSTLRDYLKVREILAQIDIPRRQVFIDVTILEVNLDGTTRTGVAAHGGAIAGEGDRETLIFGGVQNPQLSTLLLNPLTLMGLSAGARGSQLDGSGRLLGFPVDIPRFGVMFQAIKRSSNVNVVSAPHILTTDNEKAEMTVGQNIPFPGALLGGGLATGLAGLGNVSVQRQDVALKLEITPHIGAGGRVRLDLKQTISDITSPNFNGLGPATSKRTAKTTVVAHDQQAIVIGGLVGTRRRSTTDKIPLLGDIPFLGRLFSYRSETKVRTNIVIVLTPYIIRDQADLRRVFLRKLEDRRDFIAENTHFIPEDPAIDLDYRHKTGLLGEINRTALDAEREAARKRRMRRALERRGPSPEATPPLRYPAAPAGATGAAQRPAKP